MVLEAFAAISLAGNIAQFVEFTSKLVAQSLKLYKSDLGVLAENVELQAIAEDLKRLSGSLTVRFLATSKADEGIVSLARSCKAEADKLLSALERLKIQPGNRRWQSVLQALRHVWEKERVEEFQKNIGRFQAQLVLHLVVLTSDQQSSVAKDVWALSRASTQMNMNTTAQLERLKSAIEELKQITYEKMQSDRVASGASAIPKSSTQISLDISMHLQQLESTECMQEQIQYGTDDVKQISAKLENVVTTGFMIAAEQGVLHSLQFESMRMRQSNIAEAHMKTFDWIFKPSTINNDDASLQNQFFHWLCSRDGVFWVSGKPGSGKSTLMKYLYNHQNTRTFLRTWAGSWTLVCGSYFFWNAGTELQKSQQGLLQSLLYEVLRQCPSLIETVVPSRWYDLHAQKGASRVSYPWTREELLDAFDRLVQQKVTSAKFCFFIDGLDEYDGDHREIIDILNKFTTSANIKICLSSRPWNVFEDAYGQDKTLLLRLQDLTRNDIRLYVRNKLEENERFTLLKTKDSRYQDLVEEIVDKADGVFLWVVLVVRSLKEGITNADTISILTVRLRGLPSDLESYFRHILSRVDKVYWEGTAQAFQMAVAAVGPLPLWSYSVLDEEDPDFAVKARLQPLLQDRVEEMSEELEKRLNARCKGLLEVTISNPYTDIFSRKMVDFLHRTVRDFLRLSDIQNLLAARLENPFDANVALCKAFLVQAKAVPAYERSLLVRILDDFSYYARQIEKLSQQPPTVLLDEFARLVNPNKGPESIPLLPVMIHKGLLLYVKQKLHDNPGLPLTARGTSPLDIALIPSLVNSRHEAYIEPELVKLLLDHGVDPNHDTEGFIEYTTWTRFLRWAWMKNSPSDEERRALFKVAEMLLRSGADPKARVVTGDESLSISDVFTKVFSADEAALLKQLLSSQQTMSHRQQTVSCSHQTVIRNEPKHKGGKNSHHRGLSREWLKLGSLDVAGWIRKRTQKIS
ncbi:MAG: hypothetical protein M1840_006542 [Geoglossum simile]|nr:MAG: hypothetical protein M1840_006542 [Geoglossum simile]